MGRGAAGTLGERAERYASEYLRRRGLQAVDSNFRCRGGEIDLIMRHDTCLVFVEVRFRRSARFTDPEITVDRRKQRKLLRTAAMFLARNGHYARFATRFDVVAITGSSPPRVRWIRDAFRPQDSML